MKIKELEDKWKKQFEYNIKSVKKMITSKVNDDDYEKSVADFMRWIVEGDEDPYLFLPEGFHYLRDNLETTQLFLSTLHHALLDDGDVSFVTMKLRGEIFSIRLMFVDRYREDFKNFVLKENAQLIENETKRYEHAVRFTNKVNEKYKEEKKPLKALPEEFKVEHLEIISHNDFMEFKEDVIKFVKAEKEKSLIMEQRRKEILGKLNPKL